MVWFAIATTPPSLTTGKSSPATNLRREHRAEKLGDHVETTAAHGWTASPYPSSCLRELTRTYPAPLSAAILLSLELLM